MSPLQNMPVEGQAWLFPGHGTQYVGMGRELLEQWPRARELMARAEALSGLPLRQLCLKGPLEHLRRPEALEPALAALSLGHADRLRALRGPPRYVAGYSAGELTALCCAGVLTEDNALRLAMLRGRILQAEADGLRGRMVSVSGLPLSALEELVAEAGRPREVALAGRNAPDHGTLSGLTELVRGVEARAIALGAQVAEVDVACPWHSPLLAHVLPNALEGLLNIPFLPPSIPVYSSVTGKREDDPDRLRLLMAGQIARTVEWLPILEELLGRVRTIVEVGPGHFLMGMARSTAGASRIHEIRAVERPGRKLWPTTTHRESQAGQALPRQQGVRHG